jgi:hypothetical protein
MSVFAPLSTFRGDFHPTQPVFTDSLSAKLARQAQSKEKVLAKMVSGGLTEKVSRDKVCVQIYPMHMP